MAAAKVRDRSIPIAEFEMPLADALALLLPPGQVQQGDVWIVTSAGDTLELQRIRAEAPNQGGNGAQGAGRQ